MANDGEADRTGDSARTPGLRGWMESWPTWAAYLVMFVVSATVYPLMIAVLPGDDHKRSAVQLAVTGVLYSALLTGVMAFIWRKHTRAMRARTADERRQIAAALRRGHLPTGTDLDDVIRPLSVRSRAQMRSTAIVGPILYAVMVVLGVVLAITTGQLIWGAYAIVFVLVAVVTVVTAGRTQRRLLDLERRIDERADPKASDAPIG